MNDVNILDKSTTIQKIIAGDFPPSVKYEVNNVEYELPYYCVDGIYPSWALFLHTIPHPVEQKEVFFSKQQEAVRKDVERAFGVLVSRFHILSQPCRLHDREEAANVMRASIILHNMVVKSRRDNYESKLHDLLHTPEDRLATENSLFKYNDKTSLQSRGKLVPGTWATHVASREESIQNKTLYAKRMKDMVEHVYQFLGKQ